MDKLDNLISQRLIEHQRKLDVINDIKNHKRPNYHILRIPVLMAAASLCILMETLRFMPYSADIRISQPYFEEFRGSGFDIVSQYISEGEYDAASAKIDSLLMLSRSDIKEASSIEDETQRKYLLDIENDYYSELLWGKIYICIMTDKHDLAKALASEYLSVQNGQKHQSEALKILNN